MKKNGQIRPGYTPNFHAYFLKIRRSRLLKLEILFLPLNEDMIDSTDSYWSLHINNYTLSRLELKSIFFSYYYSPPSSPPPPLTLVYVLKNIGLFNIFWVFCFIFICYIFVSRYTDTFSFCLWSLSIHIAVSVVGRLFLVIWSVEPLFRIPYSSVNFHFCFIPCPLFGLLVLNSICKIFLCICLWCILFF